MSSEFRKFGQFIKLEDVDSGPVVWGIATLESPDLDREICDYKTAVPVYRTWSEAALARTTKAGQEPSLGNVRLQHGLGIGGKVTKIEFDDDNKRIMLGSVPVNDEIYQQLKGGFLTGYSQDGSYAYRVCNDCGSAMPMQQGANFCPTCQKSVDVRYRLASLSEVSYVDSPCTGEGFEYVKSTGETKIVKFEKEYLMAKIMSSNYCGVEEIPAPDLNVIAFERKMDRQLEVERAQRVTAAKKVEFLAEPRSGCGV
jgi:hypothetical protein